MFFNLLLKVVKALPWGNTINNPYNDLSKKGYLEDSNNYNRRSNKYNEIAFIKLQTKIGDSNNYISLAIYTRRLTSISNFEL